MANVSILTAPTILQNEVAVSATATLPTFAAGTNRIVLITVHLYNGGGTVNTPISVTCNGKTATFLCGDASGSVQTRLASATFYFKESDISSINGQVISTGSGATGSFKSVEYAVLQDSAQTTPTNTNTAYTNTGSITLPLTRANNSLTVAFGYTSVSSQTLTFTPTKTGNVSFTSKWSTYYYAADSAGTSNFLSNVQGYTSVHIFNVNSFPTGTIDTVNGSAYGAVKAGSSGNTVTVTGFVPTSGTLGGKAISALSGGSGSYTFTSASYVDGGSYPEPDTTKTLQLTDGTSSPTANLTLSSPNGMTSVVINNAITDDDKYLAYWILAAGKTVTNGNRIVYKTSEVTVNADTGVSAQSAVVTTMWLWEATGGGDGNMTQMIVTINDAGVVSSVGITSRGLSSGGLTSAGLTSLGL